MSSNSLNNLCHSSGGLKGKVNSFGFVWVFTLAKDLYGTKSKVGEYVLALDLFDEFLSHWLWIGGICGFVVCIISSQKRVYKRMFADSIKFRSLSILETIGVFFCALVYGVLFWAHNIEGNTVILGIPFSLLVSAYVFVAHRRISRVSAVFLLFGLSHIVTLSLFAYWYNKFQGFPEFSELPKGTNFIGSFYTAPKANMDEL